jgi:glyoxylase-like metal-dependent hydrolase (beta-lactamase superfamily II)
MKHAVYGKPVEVMLGVNVLLAENAKDYTGPGTNTYLVGDERLWIIDPGPQAEKHAAAIVAAIDGRPVDGILVTHSHLDHSPAAQMLKAVIDTPIYGFSPLDPILAAHTEEDIDYDFAPDRALTGGETLGIGRWAIEVLHTPGHFPNHLCYMLPHSKILFSGDHVMEWSTTVIVPPLGNLKHYMESLDVLENADAVTLLPSHGDPVFDAKQRICEIREHRMMRHAQIQRCLAEGVFDIPEIVSRLYEGLTPRLIKAASGCVEAHLELLRLEHTGFLKPVSGLVDSLAQDNVAEKRQSFLS